MILWLFTIILACLFFSLAYLGDKLILSGAPKASSYTFFVGMLSALIVLMIPFVKFGLPDKISLIWIILTAIVYVAGLYYMFDAVEKYDVTKVMATIGATQPIFIFLFSWIAWGPQTMSGASILAFVLLFLGSILISFEKSFKTTGEFLKLTIISSLLFSLDYIFQKFIFLNQPFWQGLIWTRIMMFLIVLVFLLPKKSRQEIFSRKGILNRKTGTFFIIAQTSGGVANILQSMAIFLVPVGLLPILNSLKGVQYVFLFLMTLFLSFFMPKILKEEISKTIIAQKIVSIILIAGGLVILVI